MLYGRRHPSRKLTAYLHGELSPAESAAVRDHVAGCAACRRQARALERVVRLARDPVRPAVPAALDPPFVDLAARRRGMAGGARLAAAFAAAAAGALLVWRETTLLRPAGSGGTGIAGEAGTGPREAPLERAALRLHRERLRGTLAFDVCEGSPDEVRTWVCRESGLETQTPAGAGGGRACASLVTAAGAPAALVAFDSGPRRLTLLTARRQDLASPAAWPRSAVSLRDPATGVSLSAWADADQAFVLVGGAPGG